MNKRLTVNSLAKSSLKARKKQYTFMIIGIVLAMIFSSSVLLLADCMKTSTNEMRKNAYGAQDGIWINVTEDNIKTAVDKGYFSSYGFSHAVGFAYIGEDKRQTGVSLGWFDENAKELSRMIFIEGRYPEAEDEIAAEEQFVKKWLGKDAKLGDKVTLNILTQNGNYYLDEPTVKTYTLVGIAKRKMSELNEMAAFYNDFFDSYVGAFVCKGTQTELGGKERLSCYFNFAENTAPLNKVRSALLDITGRNSGSHLTLTTDFSLYAVAGYQNLANSALVSTVITVVLIISSCLGIISTMSNSLSDREKQIGMLRTVGATKRQIINIFGRETFIISLICAPVSVTVSFFSVKLLISLLGDEFIFAPKGQILVLCCLSGVVCVMLSSLIVLSKAARISPIQSIRNIDLNRKMKVRHIKTQKNYDMSKLLAKRNRIFTRKSQIATSILLIITLIGACAGVALTEALVNDEYHSTYDYEMSTGISLGHGYFENINISDNRNFNDNEIAEILSNPYIKSVNGRKSVSAIVNVDGYSDYLKTLILGSYIFDENDLHQNAQNYNSENIDKFFEKYSDEYLLLRDEINDGNNFYNIVIRTYSEKEIEEIAESTFDGKLDIDKLNSGEEVLLIAPKEIAFWIKDHGNYSTYGHNVDEDILKQKDYLKKATCDIKAGDILDISILVTDDSEGLDLENLNISQRTDKSLKIGAVASKQLLNTGRLSFTDSLLIVTTNRGLRKILPEATTYDQLFVTLNTDCNEEIDAQMTDFLSEMCEKHDGYFYSEFEFANEQRSQRSALVTAAVCIIILFISIAIVIINNTLSSRIRKSKHEIGTMRAVGARRKDIVISYVRQLLSMLSSSYIISAGVIGIGIIIQLILEKSLHTKFGFQIKFMPSFILSLIIFAICSLNLFFKVRKEMKNSIIENIREL